MLPQYTLVLYNNTVCYLNFSILVGLSVLHISIAIFKAAFTSITPLSLRGVYIASAKKVNNK